MEVGLALREGSRRTRLSCRGPLDHLTAFVIAPFVPHTRSPFKHCLTPISLTLPGHEEAFVWMIDQKEVVYAFAECVYAAAAKGYLGILRILEKRSLVNDPTPPAVEQQHGLYSSLRLASNICMDMLFYSKEQHMTWAVNCAAKEGRLEIVKWLHANRKEGCSARARYHATKNGHFGVVRWLREHRPECKVFVDVFFYSVLPTPPDWMEQNARTRIRTWDLNLTKVPLYQRSSTSLDVTTASIIWYFIIINCDVQKKTHLRLLFDVMLITRRAGLTRAGLLV